MNRVILILLSLSCCNYVASAQKIYTAPLAGTMVLRDVEDKYNARVISFTAPEPDGEGEQAALRVLKAQVDRQFPHRRASANTKAKATAVAQPVIVKGFVPDSLSGIPPDNYMAVGNNETGINVMNGNISTVNTASGTINSITSLMSFSSSVGLNNPVGQSNNYRYDPKVMYDPEADRFFCVMLNGTNNYNWIVLAFSQTNDPLGAWKFYKLYGDYAGDTTWFDYPAIAITHNEVFLTGNKLVYNGSFQTGFRKSVIYQMRKADGYAGAPNLTYQLWDTVNYGGAPIRNAFPVKGGASIKGRAQYFLSVRNMAAQNDSVFLIKIPDTIGSAGNAISITAMKSNLVYGFPPNGRQPNTNKKLQTNDARVLGACTEGNEIQFVSNTVVPATGAVAIYHGRMANYTTTPSVTADYITVDTLDFAYPNISYAGAIGGKNASIISFDYSGPSDFPGFGAVMWDGTAHSPLLKVKTGDSIIRVLNDTVQRWGDYTGSQPLWTALGNVWTVGLYGKLKGSYGIWMAQLRSPFVVGVTPITGVGNTASLLYPNPAFRYIRLRFNVEQESTLHFALYTITGSLVDGVLDARCTRGENEIEFNTAALVPGQYLLKGTSGDGMLMVSKTFVKD